MDLGDIDDRPLSVLVAYQVRTENNSVDEWLDVWSVRAEDARVATPGTGAYASTVNLADETNVMIFERYPGGASGLAVDMARPSHAVLADTMGTRAMTKRRVWTATFSDVDGVGWWKRPGAEVAAGSVLIALGFRFDSEEDRTRYFASVKAHGDYCWDAEPQTLVYSGGIATGDADPEIDCAKVTWRSR